MKRFDHSLKKPFRKKSSRCFPVSDLSVLAAYSAKSSTNPSGPMGGWISDLAKDNFAIAGPYYPPRDDPNWLNEWMKNELADCMKHNLCLAYTIVPRRTVADPQSPKYHGPVGTPIRVANVNAHGDDEVTHASADQMEVWVADVEQQIQATVADPDRNKRIAVWAIMPEEMRYWRAKELELLQRLHNAVKQHDPLQRPTMMYEPQHASAERLEKTIPYQDIVTVGIYPHTAGNGHKRIQVRHTMRQIMQVLEKTGSKAPPIPALEMFEDDDHPYDPADIPLIPKFVKHDAYCAFANGAKGFFIFSMGRRNGFATYTDYYNAWAKVSNELFALRLRSVFRNGKVIGEATVAVTSGQQEIQFQWHDVDETYPSISVREWFYKKKKYVLLVNSSEGPVGFVLNGIKKGIYKDLFTNEKHIVKDGSLSLSLSSLGVMILRKRIFKL